MCYDCHRIVIFAPYLCIVKSIKPLYKVKEKLTKI